MNLLPYTDIRAEYRNYQANTQQPVDFETYAQHRDIYEGTPGRRQLAYEDNIVKRVSGLVDAAIESTGVPELTGELGRMVGGDFGAEIGREVPRMMVDFLPMMATGGAGAAVRAAGYLGSGAMGASNVYTRTDDPWAALVAGGVGTATIPAVARAGARFGGMLPYRKALSQVERMSQHGMTPTFQRGVDLVQRRAAETTGRSRLGAFLGEQGALLAQGEALNLASGYAPSWENFKYNLAGNIAFLPFDVIQHTRAPRTAGGAKLFGSLGEEMVTKRLQEIIGTTPARPRGTGLDPTEEQLMLEVEEQLALPGPDPSTIYARGPVDPNAPNVIRLGDAENPESMKLQREGRPPVRTLSNFIDENGNLVLPARPTLERPVEERSSGVPRPKAIQEALDARAKANADEIDNALPVEPHRSIEDIITEAKQDIGSINDAKNTLTGERNTVMRRLVKSGLNPRLVTMVFKDLDYTDFTTALERNVRRSQTSSLEEGYNLTLQEFRARLVQAKNLAESPEAQAAYLYRKAPRQYRELVTQTAQKLGTNRQNNPNTSPERYGEDAGREVTQSFIDGAYTLSGVITTKADAAWLQNQVKAITARKGDQGNKANALSIAIAQRFKIKQKETAKVKKADGTLATENRTTNAYAVVQAFSRGIFDPQITSGKRGKRNVAEKQEGFDENGGLLDQLVAERGLASEGVETFGQELTTKVAAAPPDTVKSFFDQPNHRAHTRDLKAKFFSRFLDAALVGERRRSGNREVLSEELKARREQLRSDMNAAGRRKFKTFQEIREFFFGPKEHHAGELRRVVDHFQFQPSNPRAQKFYSDLADSFRPGLGENLRSQVKHSLKQLFSLEGYSPERIEYLSEIGGRVVDTLPALETVRFGLFETRDITVNEMNRVGVFAHLPATRQHGALTFAALANDIMRRNPQAKGYMKDFMALYVASHELVHSLESNFAADTQMSKVYHDMEAVAKSLTLEERQAIMYQTLAGIVPKEMFDTYGDFQTMLARYEDVGEFIADYAGLGFLTLAKEGLSGVKKFKEDLKFDNPAFEAFTQMHFRNIFDIQEAVADALTDPMWMRSASGVVKSFDATAAGRGLRELNKGLRMLAERDPEVIASYTGLSRIARTLSAGAVDTLVEPPILPVTDRASEAFYREFKGVGRTPKQIGKARSIIGRAAQFLRGVDEYQSENKPGFWMSNFALFSQYGTAAAKRGYRSAQKAVDSLFSLQPRYTERMRTLMGPFLRMKDGVVRFDESHPLYFLLKDKGTEAVKIRKAFNETARYMQDLGAAMKESDPMVTINDPRVIAFIEKRLQGVSEEKKLLFPKAVESVIESYRNASLMLLDSLGEDMTYAALRALQVKGELPNWEPAQAPVRSAIREILLAADDNNAMQLVEKYSQTLQEAGLTKDGASLVATMAYGRRESFQKTNRVLDTQSGFFMSERRPGRYMITYKKGNEEGTRTIGARDRTHLQETIRELQNEGFEIVDHFDKFERYGHVGFMPERVANKVFEQEQEAVRQMLDQLEQQYGMEIRDTVAETFRPVEAVVEASFASVQRKVLKERRFDEGRERLDYIEAFIEYQQGLASSLTKKQIRQEVELSLRNEDMREAKTTREHIELQRDFLFNNETPEYQTIRHIISGYFLGGNLSSMLVESTQPFVSLVPHLVELGHSAADAYKTTVSSMREVMTVLWNKKKLRALAEKDDAYAQLARAIDNGEVAWGYLDELNIGRDRDNILHNNVINGSTGDVSRLDVAKNKVVAAARIWMKPYNLTTTATTMTAFLSAAKLGKKQGLKGQDLYAYAIRAKNNSMFAGGKAAKPLLYGKSGRYAGVTGVAMTLSHFGLGMVTMMAEYINRGYIDPMRSFSGVKPKYGDMTKAERAAARKAGAIMLGTQVALSGAIGLPFAGAALTILDNMFEDIDIEGEVRRALASLAGDDTETGGLIQSVAMNGVANHILGIDLGGRTGLNSIVGFSDYEGFNIANLAGPGVAVVQNFVDTIKQGIKGQPVAALQSFAPQGLKNVLNFADTYYKYGDFRFVDNSDNVVMFPNEVETFLSAIGFRPLRLQQSRTAQNLAYASSQAALKRRDREYTGLARQLVNGNPYDVLNELQGQALINPAFDGKEALNMILDRAYNMVAPKDVLQRTSTAGAARTREIANLFGDNLNRRSEVERLRFNDQILRTLGYPFGMSPPTPRQYERAQVIDNIRRRTGLSRTEVIQLLEQEELDNATPLRASL